MLVTAEKLKRARAEMCDNFCKWIYDTECKSEAELEKKYCTKCPMIQLEYEYSKEK